MDILIITVLIIAAVILFLVELFIIPGISLAGISALACIIYANYYAFANLGTGAGFITLTISVVTCIARSSGLCVQRCWTILPEKESRIHGRQQCRKASESRRYWHQHHTSGTNRICRNRWQHCGGEVN